MKIIKPRLVGIRVILLYLEYEDLWVTASGKSLPVCQCAETFWGSSAGCRGSAAQQLSSSACQMCRAGRDETTVSGYRWCFLFIVLVFLFSYCSAILFFINTIKVKISICQQALPFFFHQCVSESVCEWMRETEIKKTRIKKEMSEPSVYCIQCILVSLTVI